MTLASTVLSPLSGADGSATYSTDDYKIIGAVNGPIEVQRRDELPEEATIEVVLRPAVGVGSIRERRLESVLHSTLRRIILTQTFPRSLIQLTLQIISTPQSFSAGSSFSVRDLLLLPPLLQTTLLTLLSASLPLATTFTSIALGFVAGKIEVLARVDPKILDAVTSVHVFAFTATGAVLVSESEGSFGLEEWERAHDLAREVCCAEAPSEGIRSEQALRPWLKQVVLDKVENEQSWKT